MIKWNDYLINVWLFLTTKSSASWEINSFTQNVSWYSELNVTDWVPQNYTKTIIRFFIALFLLTACKNKHTA